MEDRRLVIIGVGVVLVMSSITLMVVTLSKYEENDGANDPEERNATTPLLLISLDGFRSDYIFRYATTLETLARGGVKAHYMMPSYPTVTFPNHYTIVTGLYPESHGIIANFFYDPEYNETFEINDKDGKWWGGEPIWITLNRQNKTSATYFWPGSDVNIMNQYPTEWRNFNKTIPFEERVDQVVEWLSRTKGRPDWVSLYLEEPDGSGHDDGPNSFEVDIAVARVDGMINRLLSGLRRNNMEDKVNIIILADHGMAETNVHKSVNLSHYVPNLNISTSQNTFGALTMLRLNDNSEGAVHTMLNSLSCPNGAPYIRAFLPSDLPTRFHFSNNRRIGDIVLDFDSGYYVPYKEELYLKGEHGYDNHYSTMNALFIATGPDFKKGVTLEPFQNIEIYNLLCYLTGVDPAPNNGTEGALYAALVDPPPLPELPLENLPPAPEFPQNFTKMLMMANCTGVNEDDQKKLLSLNITVTEQNQLIQLHLPWGVPLSGDLSADIILLHHIDHVTGYSQIAKMPIWTSFTVTKMPTPTPYKEWISDVRLNTTTTATCDSYQNSKKNIFMYPLFPVEFSANETLDVIPFMVSNAVPLYNATNAVKYIRNFLAPTAVKSFLPFNVMLGTVFDNDADSLPDDFNKFTIPEIPSDIFAILTYCKEDVAVLRDCKDENVDVISIIAPEYETVNNTCHGDVDYIDGSLYLSTLHDVELATGLTFFPTMNITTRLQLALKIHTNFCRTSPLVC